MSKTRELIFFIVFLSVWTLIHTYLGYRLVYGSSLRVGLRWAAYGALTFTFFISLIVFFGGRGAPKPAWYPIVAWTGYISMGLIFVLWPLTLFRDLGLVSYSLIRSLMSFAMAQGEPSTVDIERRVFLTNASNAVIGISAFAMSAIGLVSARRRAAIKRVEVPIVNLTANLDGFRIVQITDVHVGPTIHKDELDKIVDGVNSLRPDMVAVTGDIIDGFVNQLREHVAPFKRLQSKYGTFFVTGNHEYYWGAEDWIAHFESLGFAPLINAHRVIEHNGARLLVAGVTDFTAASMLESHASDPNSAVRNAPTTDARILLAHQPKSISAALEVGFDLQISGHTHGGQFFPWNLLVGLVQPLAAGLKKFPRKPSAGTENALSSMWVYVSRGTGYWGPPNRFGSPSEITEIILRRA